MTITLRCGKKLNDRLPKMNSKVHVELVPQQVAGRDVDNLRKYEYPKAKVTEQVQERPPPPFLQGLKRPKRMLVLRISLTQNSKYAMYLKNVMTNKTKLQDIEMLVLTKEYNSVVMKKIPKKLKDLGSFTLPIKIGDNGVFHTLSDLEISVNLMPLSVFNTLGLEKSKLCSVVIQIADKTQVHPKEIIEDVLIKVGKFIIPAKFIVLDYDADDWVIII
ncbi:uncharacterized protein LOC107846554 [Capsicum annuum]|uniref:uncharacterized protein LOC107846554 n=1 Tax=Capsicum annuum TaxID=4072 RepID=UPI001FB15CA6|nr:uncharacterized protein LOC107846554 [Capsicum annuum]